MFPNLPRVLKVVPTFSSCELYIQTKWHWGRLLFLYIVSANCGFVVMGHGPSFKEAMTKIYQTLDILTTN
jgi:hypothetical protein